MQNQSGPASCPFEVFYDGACPLCLREINWLQRRNEKRNRSHQIQFIDIAADSFSADQYGKTFEELMAEIHGRQPDGTWVIGVEVFRRLYATAGFRVPVAASRWVGIRHGLDLAYRLFAKYRTRLTGRCKKEGCRAN